MTRPRKAKGNSKLLGALSSNDPRAEPYPSKTSGNNQLQKQEGHTNRKPFTLGFLTALRRFFKGLSRSFSSEPRYRLAKTLRESLGALAFNIIGIVAGTIIAYYSGLFSERAWIVLVYPSVMSARGVIGGLFCGRLSTALHLGTIQPRFLGNTKSFHLLFRAVVVLTFEASVGMSLVAVLFGSVFVGITMADFMAIMSVTVATMALALLVVSPLTIAVSFISFKRGLDPDVVLYPVESTVSDLFITIIYVLVVNLFLQPNIAGQITVCVIGLVLILASAYYLTKTLREPEFVKTIRESLLALVFVAFIVNITGSTLGKISEAVGERREIYTVYPAMIDTMGDVGAVIGSTATTRLALGTLRPSLFSIRNHATEICGVWAASSILYTVYAFLSLAIQGQLSQFNLLRFVAQLLFTSILAGGVIVMVSYMVAVLTYRKGLDPDNFVIPIESSLADSITTISLLLALSLFI